MKILAAGATDTGKVRSSNEDAFLVDTKLGLFAVADGMGGHQAGEVASHLALETLHRKVASGVGAREDILRAAIEAASEAVKSEAAADPAKARMGTTLTALLVGDDGATVGHVGDSRLYRVRWGEVEKLTQDHTAVAELVRAGAVSESEAATHPWAHILSRVVGGKEAVQVEILPLDLVPGDRFLLCSDGFSDSLTDPRWLTLLEERDPDDSAAQLVARAVDVGGQDNATAVVVAWGDQDKRAERRTTWDRFKERVKTAIGDITSE